jgi:hypothetical protein
MKTLIITVTLLLIGNTLIAQKNFEGKIVYELSESSGRENGTIEAFFRNQKVKAHIIDKSKSQPQDDIIIDLTNGKIYYLDLLNKEYSVDSVLSDKVQAFPQIEKDISKNKYILGYSCKGYSGVHNYNPKPEDQKTFTTWLADSLFFIFDKKYSTNDMIPLFGNGENIAMGFDMEMNMDSKIFLFTAKPISVEEKLLHDSLFLIPLNYQLKNSEANADGVKMIEEIPVSEDSAAIAVRMAVEQAVKTIDSLAKAAEKDKNNTKSQKKQPKKSPTQDTHNPSTKSPAIKPKQ